MSAPPVQTEAFEPASTSSAAPDETTVSPARIEALHAGPVGAALAGAVAFVALIATGVATAGLDAVWIGAAVFLAVVVQQDTLTRKIPNWLTGTGLVAAIAWHASIGGAAGAGTAVIHALVPFGLLILPFALGAIGAGDVKVFMVLGALFGLSTVLPLIAWSAVIAGVVAFIWLWSQGEAWLLFAQAFSRIRSGKAGDPPKKGKALGSALPLGAAIAAAVIVHALLGDMLS